MTEVLPKSALETADQAQDIDLINEVIGFVNRLQPITDLSRDSYKLKDVTTAPAFYQSFGLCANMQIDICETGLWVNLIKPTHGIRRGKDRCIASFYFYNSPAGIAPKVTTAEAVVPKKAIFYALVDDALASNEQLDSLVKMFKGAAGIYSPDQFKQPKQKKDPGTVTETLEQLRVTQTIERAISFGEAVREKQIGIDTKQPKFEISKPGVYYFDQDTRHPHPSKPEVYEPNPNFVDHYTVLVTAMCKIIINKASSGMNTVRIVEPNSILNINTRPDGGQWVSNQSQIADLWSKFTQTERAALEAATS